MALLLLAGAAVAQEGQTLGVRVLENPEFAWKSLERDNVRIYFQPGSFAERHRYSILRSLNAAMAEVLEALDEEWSQGVFQAFYLDSREEMETAVGRPVAGLSDWGDNSIVVVMNEGWRSFELHEFTHVVTMGIWGSPHESCGWMIEGIANALDGWCQEYSVEEVVHRFLADEQLPPLATFFNEFSTLGEIRAGFYGATFIRFLMERHGLDTVKALWVEGADSLSRDPGLSLQDLETGWKSYVRSKVLEPRDIDLDRIDEEGCG